MPRSSSIAQWWTIALAAAALGACGSPDAADTDAVAIAFEKYELAERYLDGGRMAWLVVGDGRTQLERLGALGLGLPSCSTAKVDRLSGRDRR